MKRVVFMSRATAATWQPASGAVLVSVYDKSEEAFVPQSGWAAILRLRFHDTDGSVLGLEVFSPEQAQALLAFVKAHAEASELVVHCQMGQSRSAGIALYFAEREGLPCFRESQQVNAATWNGYSRFVYGRLLAQDSAD